MSIHVLSATSSQTQGRATTSGHSKIGMHNVACNHVCLQVVHDIADMYPFDVSSLLYTVYSACGVQTCSGISVSGHALLCW